MRFEQLRYLETALRTGSFRQAAKELHVSQPTITSQVQRLEEELGLLLVTRGAKGITPTYAAERILPHVTSAVRSERLLREEASAISGLQLGEVRLGTVPAASQTLLPAVVSRLLSDYPSLSFVVAEGPSKMVARGVLSNTFDVGLVTRLAGIELVPGEDDVLHRTDLLSGRIVLAVPEEHPIASKDHFEPADLDGEPLIVPSETSILKIPLEKILEGVDARVVYTSSNGESTNAMVRAGVGISIANTLAPSTVSGDGIVLVPLQYEWAHATTSVIVRAHETRSSAVQAFLKLLRDAAAGTA